MMRGRRQSARAMATRCCCPPESWIGYLPACSITLTLARYSRAVCSASAAGVFKAIFSAKVQFSSTVMCGKRLKLWNTMPSWRRTCSTLSGRRVSAVPLTWISPESCCSRWLMHRMSDDLPDPEGPHRMTISPLDTSRWISRSAWNDP
ncbi:hypothetical protein G6F23_015211 [Rhizopus arrhizus]|nr:hypothetical protein G6F23_015211 [Rhizopus arrhizus]